MKNLFSAVAQAVSISGIRQVGSGNNSITINGNGVSGVEPAGPVASKEVAIYPFRTLEAGGAFDITVRLGTEPKLTFTAEERVLDQLEAYLTGDRLELTTVGDFSTQGPLKADLVVTSLEGICLSGAAKLTFENVAADTFRVEVDGAASLRLEGTAAMLVCNASGAARVNAQNLKASDARVDITGAANAKVCAIACVRGGVSGAASLKVSGNPPQRVVGVSGAASVKYA